MIKSKILTPSNNLFNQDYKLSYFCENLSKYEENQMKVDNSDIKRSKKLKKWFKRDILHIKMFKTFCSECYTNKVNKDEIKKRILYFFMFKVK
jgi:hypothetical protein